MGIGGHPNKKLIENMPTAFAYHKVIYNEDNKPIDYVFLKVNHKFEELTSLKREEVINKKATDVLDNIVNDKFDWIQFYGEVALTGKSIKFQEYSEPLGRWYEVKAYSNEKGYFTTILNDITERKLKEKELKEKNERLNNIFNNSNDIIFSLSWPELQIEFASRAVEDIFGFTAEEFKESASLLRDITHPDDKYIHDQALRKIKESGYAEREFRIITKEGNVKWIHDKGKMIYDEDNNPVRIQGVMREVTDRKKKEKKIKYLSYRDHLTGLYNRRYFEEEMERLDTKRQLPLSIIMVDINGLKIINDSYGHESGDQMLIETGKILKEEIRKEDIVARHGGDEFTILLPHTPYKEAKKIISRLQDKNNKNSKEGILISFSLGIATKENEEEDIKEALKKADDDIYRNKLSESRSNKHRIVQNLLNTLNAKSSETKEHAMRMTRLARALGEKMGFSISELNNLSLLATLHDIGKTTISEDILTKPGKLTDKEWEIMKEHPARGFKITSASEEFIGVAEDILYHHERWDGKGYPDGLAGEEIPYLARIIAIIDAYDVMTNERPYSKAISKEEALAEIKECAGSQFDPGLAQEFIELKSKNG